MLSAGMKGCCGVGRVGVCRGCGEAAGEGRCLPRGWEAAAGMRGCGVGGVVVCRGCGRGGAKTRQLVVVVGGGGAVVINLI